MRQAVSAQTKAGRGVSPQASSIRAQSFRKRAELGNGKKLVLVGSEAEEDRAARLVEIQPMSFQRAQIGKGIRQHKAKFLCLRAAGRMHWSAIRDGEGAGEAFGYKVADQPGHDGSKLGPRHGECAAHRSCAERIEAKTHVQRRWLETFGPDIVGHQRRDLPGGRTEIELDPDACIEMDAIEDRGDGLLGRRQRIAVVADSALEDEADPVRTITQVIEDLRVGGLRIGQVDPLHDRPGRGRPAGDALSALRARVERLDGNAVIALRSEGGERRVLQRLCHKGLPRCLVGGREVAGKGQFHHSPQALRG